MSGWTRRSVHRGLEALLEEPKPRWRDRAVAADRWCAAGAHRPPLLARLECPVVPGACPAARHAEHAPVGPGRPACHSRSPDPCAACKSGTRGRGRQHPGRAGAEHRPWPARATGRTAAELRARRPARAHRRAAGGACRRQHRWDRHLPDAPRPAPHTAASGQDPPWPAARRLSPRCVCCGPPGQ